LAQNVAGEAGHRARIIGRPSEAGQKHLRNEGFGPGTSLLQAGPAESLSFTK
jgi:hypothetical protein